MKTATSAEKRVSYLLSANDNRRVVSKKRCFQVQTKSKEVTMTNQKTSAKSNEPMMTPPPFPLVQTSLFTGFSDCLLFATT